MIDNGIVNIHGKDYVTVARRVEMLHEDKELSGIEIETEILTHEPVVMKATVKFVRKESKYAEKYTGISSVSINSAKMIEKQNPYEVAETSAVGRALGFAGYGIVEGIASADEINKSAMISDRSIACTLCYAPAGKPHATGCRNI